MTYFPAVPEKAGCKKLDVTGNAVHADTAFTVEPTPLKSRVLVPVPES